MKKRELFKPVTRTINGITITFTSKEELKAYDDELRKRVAENRKKAEAKANAENGDSPYKNEITFTPDFSL